MPSLKLNELLNENNDLETSELINSWNEIPPLNAPNKQDIKRRTNIKWLFTV